eukprot:TRINITY_DN5076_c0_g1_i1.p1 TRINITY_DN5076_c0_g1~~TRINITY_DN5076_c0_g1_i1.p1  ORF type:complete len:574 (-),score=179.58 TRINITY_DN5076_c0_g1_i1:2103-3728(-)
MKADGLSWGDDIQRYLDEKRSQSVPMEPVFRMTRDKSHLWRGEELKYDPLMQILRDPDQEMKREDEEHERRIRQLNQAMDRTLRYESGYDVINHRDKRTGEDGSLLLHSATTRRVRPTTSVDYDIIANIPKPHTAMTTATREREDEGDHDGEDMDKTNLQASRLLVRKPKTGKRTHPELARKIDYDIITQKYIEDDEERRKMEEEMETKRLQERFDDTHIFHPLQQRYFDPTLDVKERELDEKMWKDARTIKASRIPPTMKSAEGLAYDITGFHVKQPERLEALDRRRSARSRQMQRMRTMMADKIRQREEDYENIVQRAFRRTLIRHTHPANSPHKFDVVSNVPFDGIDGRLPPKHPDPLVDETKKIFSRTSWDRCLVDMSRFDRTRTAAPEDDGSRRLGKDRDQDGKGDGRSMGSQSSVSTHHHRHLHASSVSRDSSVHHSSHRSRSHGSVSASADDGDGFGRRSVQSHHEGSEENPLLRDMKSSASVRLPKIDTSSTKPPSVVGTVSGTGGSVLSKASSSSVRSGAFDRSKRKDVRPQ